MVVLRFLSTYSCLLNKGQTFAIKGSFRGRSSLPFQWWYQWEGAIDVCSDMKAKTMLANINMVFRLSRLCDLAGVHALVKALACTM